eukprot:scaffold6111_cov107-Isochrysis_galbana.AAC.4
MQSLLPSTNRGRDNRAHASIDLRRLAGTGGLGVFGLERHLAPLLQLVHGRRGQVLHHDEAPGHGRVHLRLLRLVALGERECAHEHCGRTRRIESRRGTGVNTGHAWRCSLDVADGESLMAAGDMCSRQCSKPGAGTMCCGTRNITPYAAGLPHPSAPTPPFSRIRRPDFIAPPSHPASRRKRSHQRQRLRPPRKKRPVEPSMREAGVVRQHQRARRVQRAVEAVDDRGQRGLNVLDSDKRLGRARLRALLNHVELAEHCGAVAVGEPHQGIQPDNDGQDR